MKTIKEWIFLIDKSPDEGLCIQETDEVKYSKNVPKMTGKKIYTIWHDPYESGEAYIEDWNYFDESDSFDGAYKWCVDNYGKITEIE